ncbi:MAG TPA: ATP-binding protein [Desulfobacteraceae bacterium]|nr:ATP-binding protein [Desulfobacteraceae bacterium]
MAAQRKKLLWHIFPLFLVITTIALVAVTGYATVLFKTFSLNSTEQDLVKRGELIKREMATTPLAQQDRVCKSIGKTIDTRITVILPSGDVVADSHGTPARMENHRSRPEFQMVMVGERGVSVRYSNTLEKKMMYVALPLLDKGRLSSIVRVSVSVSAIDRKISHIQKNILGALVFIAAAAAGASLLVSRRITRPIEEMTGKARCFSQGDLTPRLAVPDSRELAQLAITMNQMAGSLDEKMKTVESRSTELEAVYASMKEGVIAVDRNEKIITINRAAAAIFELPVSTLEGKNIHEIARNYDLKQFLKKALKEAQPIEEDILIQRSQEHIFNVHSTPLGSRAIQPMGTLIIFHDITRIRLLETMQKDFAANVSHELKTPLTSVKGFVETLQEIMDQDQDSAHFLGIIEKNVNRLIALIDDLLVLSRLERKLGKETAFQQHDINAVITRAVETCQPQIAQQEIRLFRPCKDQQPDPCNGAGETITALMDPLLVEQAVVNLLTNAVKYSHRKGDVHIFAYRERAFGVIEIVDYGPGINHEHQAKIFQRFYRVDRARSREMGGTGLGLAIVKHIVQYHNGTVTVNSTPGKGSSFKIKIPILPA